MIVSKKHGFVFSRVLKTGSTSAQAMFIDSQILGSDDIYSGYRNNVDDEPTPGQNIPSTISGKMIYKITPYKIPKEIYVKGDGRFPLLGHSTPTEMVRLKFLSESDLKKFTTYGIVREPIDRFLSAWFFYCSLVDVPKTKEALEASLRKKTEFPNTFLGKTQRNFFEYEGELLKNIHVIDFKNLNEELTKIIESYGGKINEYKKLKSHHRPDWAKQPYQEWLSSDLIAKLQDLMKVDVEFYNQYTTV